MLMKIKRLFILIVFTLFSMVTFTVAWGGQVVTDEARSWAKQVFEQEKSLKVTVAPNALAVLYFSNLTRQRDLDPLQKGIAIMLITDLSKVKSLTVVERIHLQALLEEMKLGETGLVNKDTAPSVGKLLGAHWLVGGNIQSAQANLLQVKSDILDVPTTQITEQPGAQGIMDELLRMEKDLVFEIVKSLEIEPSPQEEVELRKPITTNIKALLAFSRCIDESDRKNYQEAANFCQAALINDPSFTLAQQTLYELSSLGVAGATAAGATAAGTTPGATVAGVTAGVAAIVTPPAVLIGGSGGETKPVSPF
jgi:TolB-like protein